MLRGDADGRIVLVRLDDVGAELVVIPAHDAHEAGFFRKEPAPGQDLVSISRRVQASIDEGDGDIQGGEVGAVRRIGGPNHQPDDLVAVLTGVLRCHRPAY